MEEKNYKSRGEMVGETLKQEILDLRLKPGQMISENDVCDRFGVSRTPVREAPCAFSRNRALWRPFLTGEPT